MAARALDLNVFEELKFVKGSPVKVANNTVVIEQWATWCPPCVRSIPHLNALAAKYSKIPFVGVNTSEPETTVLGGITKYNIQYNVAVDPNGALEQINTAYSVNGIPHAFIFHKNRVVFSGHPADPEFEKILATISAEL